MAPISVEEWRTLEPELNVVLDLEPAARAAYLDTVCAGAPDRRARLEELIAACERGEGLLDSPVNVLAPLLPVPGVLSGLIASSGR